MTQYYLKPIGTIRHTEEGSYVEVFQQYIPALTALNGFSHLQILWWADEMDKEDLRELLETPQPYQNAPEMMGIFATRSPYRPNPIALTAASVIRIDYEKGRIYLGYIDANDHTPVIDLKPYTPSIDRVQSPTVPNWCADWPKSAEESGAFDWSAIFKF